MNLTFRANSVSAFSFTGIDISIPITGVGADVTLASNGPSDIKVDNGNYIGAAPPNNPTLLSITGATAAPEPSTFLAFGVAALALPVLRRSRRRR